MKNNKKCLQSNNYSMFEYITNISSPILNSMLFTISMVLAFYDVIDIDTMILFLIVMIMISLFLTLFGFLKRLGFYYFIASFYPIFCLLSYVFLFFTIPGWLILVWLGFGIPAPSPN